ncbi:hypothetical protein [Sphingobacterium sp. MYb382]|uniref:hypothetical protein n=1 Tax=Sphingobacterium sp. MYb382 TaxID=2745278 RepID=UPI0030B17CF0
MRKSYLLINLIIVLLLISCNSYQNIISTNNNGGYTLQASSKTPADSVTFLITVYDINTKKTINTGVHTYLFETVEIKNKYQDSRNSFSDKPPFFTINAFGYKPMETRPISFKKGNFFTINVFLEPNSNPLTD